MSKNFIGGGLSNLSAEKITSSFAETHTFTFRVSPIGDIVMPHPGNGWEVSSIIAADISREIRTISFIEGDIVKLETFSRDGDYLTYFINNYISCMWLYINGQDLVIDRARIVRITKWKRVLFSSELEVIK